jgi:small subunit ribosomal protein S21
MRGDHSSSKFDYIQAVEAQPFQVVVHGNNFDKAFKLFRSMVQKERTLSLYKEKQGFEKPSDKKRRKRKESGRRAFETSRRASMPPVQRKRREDADQ